MTSTLSADIPNHRFLVSSAILGNFSSMVEVTCDDTSEQLVWARVCRKRRVSVRGACVQLDRMGRLTVVLTGVWWARGGLGWVGLMVLASWACSRNGVWSSEVSSGCVRGLLIFEDARGGVGGTLRVGLGVECSGGSVYCIYICVGGWVVDVPLCCSGAKEVVYMCRMAKLMNQMDYEKEVCCPVGHPIVSFKGPA
ncbi:hypothetical protein Tco_0461986 [Tanacetum coccineum]